jgi:hypothetical protein
MSGGSPGSRSTDDDTPGRDLDEDDEEEAASGSEPAVEPYESEVGDGASESSGTRSAASADRGADEDEDDTDVMMGGRGEMGPKVAKLPAALVSVLPRRARDLRLAAAARAADAAEVAAEGGSSRSGTHSKGSRVSRVSRWNIATHWGSACEGWRA